MSGTWQHSGDALPDVVSYRKAMWFIEEVMVYQGIARATPPRLGHNFLGCYKWILLAMCYVLQALMTCFDGFVPSYLLLTVK